MAACCRRSTAGRGRDTRLPGSIAVARTPDRRCRHTQPEGLDHAVVVIGFGSRRGRARLGIGTCMETITCSRSRKKKKKKKKKKKGGATCLALRRCPSPLERDQSSSPNSVNESQNRWTRSFSPCESTDSKRKVIAARWPCAYERPTARRVDSQAVEGLLRELGPSPADFLEHRRLPPQGDRHAQVGRDVCRRTLVPQRRERTCLLRHVGDQPAGGVQTVVGAFPAR